MKKRIAKSKEEWLRTARPEHLAMIRRIFGDPGDFHDKITDECRKVGLI